MITQLMKTLRIAFYVVGIPYFVFRYFLTDVLSDGNLQILRSAFLGIALIYFILMAINWMQNRNRNRT